MTQQPPTQDGNSHLVQVLDAYLAERAAGKAPSVEELIAQHPELADELRECLPSLEMIKACSVKQNAASSPGPDVPAAEGDQRSGILGDYRILREVGRGGMGVVYEAWQISLGRRVALKVLPFAATLDQRHLQRFKNEAQAAAQLHHSHIVPVFAVGVERGVHYYAMQFIDGRTLAAIIDELRQGPDPDPLAATKLGSQDPQRTAPYLTPQAVTTIVQAQAHVATERSNKSSQFFRNSAQLGLQAADALEHAHGLGVVHRDIKPANLLVDARGHLWVTDFGLAQFQRETNLTVTGDLLGTLRYMSPEQAMAKKAVIDHRTDIYSLGATLYELLTQQPVFDGQDRQTILNQVLTDEPLPPRRHNKAIPVELELIVLKALAKNLEERYLTAQELADDLKRFLDDKPILARRPTMAQHVRKWVRRHQAVVAAGAGLIVVALGATSFGSVMIWQEKNEAEKQRQIAMEQKQEADLQRLAAEAERRESDKLRKEAEAQRLLAQRALEELFADSITSGTTTPIQDKFHREFLEKSLAFFEEAAKGDAGVDPNARKDKATALRRQGDILQQLGRVDEAERSFKAAIGLLATLVNQDPANAEYKFDLVSSRLKLGNLLKARGRTTEAEKVFEEARGLSQTLVASVPDKDGYVDLLVACFNCQDQAKPFRAWVGPLRNQAIDRTQVHQHNLAFGGPGTRNAFRPITGRMESTFYQQGEAPVVFSEKFKAVPVETTHAATVLLALRQRQESVRTPMPAPPVPPPLPAPPETVKLQGPSLDKDGKADLIAQAQRQLVVPTQWNGWSSGTPNPYTPSLYQPYWVPGSPYGAPYPRQITPERDANKMFIVSGEALNVVVERLSRKLAKGAKGPDAVLDAEAVRKLNVTSPQVQGLKIIKAMQQGQELFWPAALKEDHLGQARQTFSLRMQEALTVVEKKSQVDPAQGKEIKQNLETMNKDLRQRVNDINPAEFMESHLYLIQMDAALKAVEKGDLNDNVLDQFLAQGKTMPDLVKFLTEKKLRVAQAGPGDEAAYTSVYQGLLAFEAALQE